MNSIISRHMLNGRRDDRNNYTCGNQPGDLDEFMTVTRPVVPSPWWMTQILPFRLHPEPPYRQILRVASDAPSVAGSPWFSPFEGAAASVCRTSSESPDIYPAPILKCVRVAGYPVPAYCMFLLDQDPSEITNDRALINTCNKPISLPAVTSLEHVTTSEGTMVRARAMFIRLNLTVS